MPDRLRHRLGAGEGGIGVGGLQSTAVARCVKQKRGTGGKSSDRGLGRSGRCVSLDEKAAFPGESAEVGKVKLQAETRRTRN